MGWPFTQVSSTSSIAPIDRDAAVAACAAVSMTERLNQTMPS